MRPSSGIQGPLGFPLLRAMALAVPGPYPFISVGVSRCVRCSVLGCVGLFAVSSRPRGVVGLTGRLRADSSDPSASVLSLLPRCANAPYTALIPRDQGGMRCACAIPLRARLAYRLDPAGSGQYAVRLRVCGRRVRRKLTRAGPAARILNTALSGDGREV